MPIYEYRCASCGFEKEYLQKLSDAPIAVCESCGKHSMTKLVSAAGFQLKGSGWYVTDFKDSGAKKEKPASKSEGDGKLDAAADGTTGKAADKPSTEAKTSGEAKTSSESGSAGTAKSSADAKPAAGASSGLPPAQ
jgi:putative FmdB family regulatory protein